MTTILFVCSLSIGNVQAQSVIYVDSSRASSGAGTTWATAYKTLKEATNAANANTAIKEIRIAKGTYFPTTNTNRDSSFLISRGDIRLYGGYPSGGGTRDFAEYPTILSGDIGVLGTQTDNSHHVMVIAGLAYGSDSVIIEGLRICWGRAANVSGSFTYNGQSVPRTSGGGIAMKSNANQRKIRINSCIISGNYAGNTGAGMYIESSEPEIRNCLFSGNYADYGGAVFNFSNANVYYLNCTFSGNHDNHGGGGMRNSSSTPILSNCIIIGNSDGISNNSASAVIRYSLIQGETSTANNNLNWTTNYPVFETPIASGTVNVDGNYRLKAGSSCLNKGDNSSFSSLEIDLDNQSRRYGPAIDMGAYERQDCPANLVPPIPVVDSFQFFCGSPLVNNLFATGTLINWYNVPTGGTPLSLASPLTNGTYYVSQNVNGCIGPRASAVVTIEQTIRYVKQGGSGNKSGSSWANASGDLQKMINESCENSEIWVAAGTYTPNRSVFNMQVIASASIYHAFVMKPKIKILGGFPSTGNPNLTHRNWNTYKSILSGDLNNNGSIRSSHVVILAGNSTIGTSQINGFTITKGNASGNYSFYINGLSIYSGYGAGIYLTNASLTIENCTFSENTADSWGGGIYNNNSTSTISNSLFFGNTAQRGGGMYIHSSSNSILNNCRFEENISSSDGGGLYNNESSPELNTCVFSNNTANNGGGLFNYESSPELNTCVFFQNTVRESGGGIHNYYYSSPTINNCTISENFANNGGGMFSSYGCNSLIKHSVFSGNEADDSGGGIYNSVSTSPTIANSIISGNKARLNGGGVCNVDSYDTKIINSVISGNHANSGSSFYFSYNTISNAIKNCIIYGNYGSYSNSSGIQDESYSGIVINHSIVQGGYAGNNIIDIDPLFVNAPSANSAPFTGGNYSITQPCSPAINTGINSAIPSAITIDIAGNPRIYETLVDIGAYEFQSAKSYVPKIITQPSTVNCPTGSHATISITTQNVTTFQWQVDAGSGFVNINNNSFYSGANSATLNITNPTAAMNGYLYRVVTTGACLPNAISQSVVHFFTNIKYVKNNVSGNNSGGSWANANNDLQKMINESCPGTEIWVARGIYLPNRPANNLNVIDVNNRDNAFVLKPNVKILGGFPETGNPDISQRNWQSNRTQLSGDIGEWNNHNDNCYHVVISSEGVGTTELNGFEIIRGTANGPSSGISVNGNHVQNYNGGGIYIKNSSPILNNIRLEYNTAMENGGGIYNHSGSPVISNSTISWNNTYSYGGGVFNQSAAPTFVNCILMGNTSGGNGGAIYTDKSPASFTNCKFTYNTSTYGAALFSFLSKHNFNNCIIAGNKTTNMGGGMYLIRSNVEIKNSTISGNAATYNSGGILASDSTITITNSIIYGNEGEILRYPGTTVDVTNSIIQGGFTGTGNSSANPLFLNQYPFSWAPNLGGDYRLQPCSPAINTGSNTNIPSGITTDIDGYTRIMGATVDLGAHENAGYSLQELANTHLIADGDCSASDGWIHYHKTEENSQKIFVSINAHGQNLGVISAASNLTDDYDWGSNQLLQPFGQTQTYYPFNRSWAVESSNTFTQPVSVRFYFSERDSTDIATSIPFGNLQNLILYKVNGNDVWNTGSTNYKEYIFGQVADTNHYVLGMYNGIRYAEFKVKSFSAGTMAMKIDESILPLDLISFTAVAIDNKTQLQWHTVNEVNVSHFEIERSIDGINWQKISGTNATNGIAQQYTTWDNAPISGVNYYRLKMIDLDDTYKYSKIVEIIFGENQSLQFLVYPNPNNGIFEIRASGIIEQKMTIQIFDGLGKLVHSEKITDGANSVNLKHCTSGMYYLKVLTKNGTLTYKVSID